MNNPEEFRDEARKIIDWIVDYYKNVENLPVRSQSAPGSILRQIPDEGPEEAEPMDDIMRDFENIVLPGITHWQSPRFFAYFPANASFPSLLGEFLTAGIAAQCMNWDTSPAAAELEEGMMNWLKKATGLPESWQGVIHEGASMATLTAMLTARERATDWNINQKGFSGQPVFRVYCSSEAHSSIEKSVRISGFGRDNLIKVDTDRDLAMDPELLEKAILTDLNAGFTPLMVVIAIGTTGTTAIDPLSKIAPICRKYKLWLHVDAAFAGTALLLPEYRWMIGGIEDADSFVFNPHKWMFTHFDCSAYFVKDSKSLVRTFEILPEYLKTGPDSPVNNYRDWGIPMGRRFRALKLWFVIRGFGLEEIRRKIRVHLGLAEWFEQQILAHPDFELMATRTMNLVCFRFKPRNIDSRAQIDDLNIQLEKTINDSGKIFFTHTRVQGAYTLRMVIAQTNVSSKHVEEAWDVIRTEAEHILQQQSI